MSPSIRLALTGVSARLTQDGRRLAEGLRAFFKALYETPPGC